MTKPSTNPSAEESQIPNKMELIKPQRKIPTDPCTWLNVNFGVGFRDRGSGFVVVQYEIKENLWMCL